MSMNPALIARAIATRAKNAQVQTATPPQPAPEPAGAIDEMVNLFLAWPLPKSVRSDLCVTMDYPHQRYGTNLLTADEARQMFEYLRLRSAPPVTEEMERMRAALIEIRDHWAKIKAVGNGVPLAMGRAVAKAVAKAIHSVPPGGGR